MGVITISQNQVDFLRDEAINQAGGCVHGFSTRIGGVSQGIFASLNLGMNRGDDESHVRENYRRFYSALGLTDPAIVLSSQIHEDTVRLVTETDIKSDVYDPVNYHADALVSNLPGVNLVIFGADCLSVLLYDPVRRVVGAAHAGWRGTAQNIVGKTVEKMSLFGCQPGDILAAIGPGISKCCFETHEDVPNALTSALGSCALPHISAGENGKFHVDLKGINATLLTRAGLDADHISVAQDCTACLPQKYWSHRVTQGERGSQIALIGLT